MSTPSENLISRDTREEEFAHHRKLFLTEQGYSYQPVASVAATLQKTPSPRERARCLPGTIADKRFSSTGEDRPLILGSFRLRLIADHQFAIRGIASLPVWRITSPEKWDEATDTANFRGDRRIFRLQPLMLKREFDELEDKTWVWYTFETFKLTVTFNYHSNALVIFSISTNWILLISISSSSVPSAR